MIDTTTIKSSTAKRRYLLAALLLTVAVILLGWTLDAWITGPATLTLPTSAIEKNIDNDLEQLFAAAVRQMQQRQYQQALNLWHRALLMEPDIPEIKVNMGFSLYELGEYNTARDFFVDAMEQNAYQANAYYGLAITSEKMGDLEGALGAMRSYIHLAADEQDEKFLRLARSALWEWEAQLGENSKPPSSTDDATQSSD